MEKNRGFFGVLAAVVRLAGLSLAGFLLFVVSLVSYLLAASFLVVAVMKPFKPDRVGLWSEKPGSFSLAVLDHPPPGPDMLGWWVIPVGFAVAVGLGWLTWRLDRLAIRAMVRSGQRWRA